MDKNDAPIADTVDLEDQKPAQGRIVYADDVEFGPRRPTTKRHDSSDSMSIRSMSRQRTLQPGIVLPPAFRTLSFDIDDANRKDAKGKRAEEKPENKIEFKDIDFHTSSIPDLFSRFESSEHRGLSSTQAVQILKTVGFNVPSPPPSHWFRKAIVYLFGNFGSILFIASLLVFISWKPLGDPPAPANLALAIVLALVWVIQALFSFWQDFSSSRVMASISTMLPDHCSIVRDGATQHIDGKHIVPGDVIRLTMGDKLPADVRFFEVSSDARFDRSILTGETEPLLASVNSTDENYLETACIGMAGTHCVSGTATGIVVDTGDRTVFGRIAKLTSAPKQGLTPLQKEILHFVAIIVTLMTTMILLVIIVWATWLRHAHPDWITVPSLIVDCVSVAVAFIPEGLPIAVTASLTITANIMRRNKILCKSLKTVETLGAVNVICSDKTGTLTKNQMSVTDYLIGKKHAIAPKECENYEDNKGLHELTLFGALCNAAEFDVTTQHLPLAERKINGDATDSAILRFVESITSIADLRTSWLNRFRVAFNSKNKFAITVIQNDVHRNQEAIVTIKGAPDILLPRCTSYMTENGNLVELETADREFIEQTKDQWSSNGKRVILLARKPLGQVDCDPIEQPREYESHIMEHATTGLTLVGLVGIVDPPRPEIPDVVRTLRGAGIKVFMVTGDFKLTAQAIAAECGIVTRRSAEVDDVTALTAAGMGLDMAIIQQTDKGKPPSNLDLPRALVISGAEISTLTSKNWDALCNYDEIVFARTTPEHKLRIVRELQARGQTVGMTGDGVNDAPSLKAADVGIAMGSGSDIAMEAADMVLLDSFVAIVEAVRYGRVVYDNLKKTICYLLPAGSFSEFWPVLTSVVLGLPQILSSFLMIIICCFTDCAAATAIAYEQPEADVLTRPPRNAKKDRLVDWKLVLQAYGFVGIIEATLSFAMAYWFAQRQGLAFSQLWFGFGELPKGMAKGRMDAILNEASSIYFVNLVVMQWFVLLAIRTRRLSVLQHPPWRNWYLFPAVIFALLIAVFFLYVPKFHAVLDTATVPVENWFLPFAFGTALLLLDEARKFGVRRWPKGVLARIAW